jgi:hypothetical protein
VASACCSQVLADSSTALQTPALPEGYGSGQERRGTLKDLCCAAVFTAEIKPSVREVMEDMMVDTRHRRHLLAERGLNENTNGQRPTCDLWPLPAQPPGNY